jgi:hypothetical protein
MSSLFDELTAKFDRDRVIDSLIINESPLPYSFNDIKVSHRDVILATSFNDSINKLYDNYLYLIANAEIYCDNYPLSTVSSISLNQNTLDSTFNSISDLPTEVSNLSSVRELYFTTSINSQDKIVFCYGDENSYVFKINNDYSTITGIFSGNNVEYNKEFTFSKVVSIDRNNEYLFILDQENNLIYKFDISGIIYLDPALQRTSVSDTEHPGKWLLKTIGGVSKFNLKNNLIDPTSLRVFNDYIYVLDNGNNSIKIFDTDFNYIDNIVDKELFDNNPKSITVNYLNNISSDIYIYVLTNTGHIYTYNNLKRVQVNSIFDITDNLYSSNNNKNIEFRKILSSPTNLNVIYVVTNKQIIKFFKSNFTNSIGLYYSNNSLSLLEFEEINSADVMTDDGNADSLAIFTSLSSGETKISFVKDDVIGKKLYNDQLYTDYYTLSSLTVSEQLINTITLNSIFSKIAYNHSAFLQNLSKKVYTYYSTTKVPTLCTIADNTFNANFNSSQNYIIGLNEPIMSSDIINRVLKTLYDQQVLLLDQIKETTLNSNPPSDSVTVLPITDSKSIQSVIEWSADIQSQTISAGDNVYYQLIRSKTEDIQSCKFYTELGSNTLSSDIFPYVDISDPLTITFEKGIGVVDIVFSTEYSTNNIQKGFTTYVIEPTGAVINQNNLSRVTTINPNSTTYTLSLSSSTTFIREGNTYTFAVTRSNTNNTFADEVSCNVYSLDVTTSNLTDYTAIPFTTTYSSVCAGSLDFDYVNNSNNTTTIAKNITETSTIVFSPGVSAVQFEFTLSADDIFDPNEQLKIKLHNPSSNATIDNSADTINLLTLDNLLDISIDINVANLPSITDNKIANINIFEILSANQLYQDLITNSMPVSVNATITDPLTVYSTDINIGAIYYDTEGEEDKILPGSILTLTVNNSAAYIIGKGGNGAAGLYWVSGTEFTYNQADTVLYTSVSAAESGGPAISLSSFSFISIDSVGNIYGGGGGGGAGFFAISAEPMLEISAISATAGGGGGAGYIDIGSGTGGIIYADVDFVRAGTDSNGVSGGAGGVILGTVGGYDVTLFKVLSGGDGGNIGLPGSGADMPDDVSGYDSSFDTLTANLVNVNEIYRRRGGNAGKVVTGVNWSSRLIDTLTGNFGGDDI